MMSTVDVGASTLRWQRWLVLATLVGSALIVWWWQGDDNFALPKATFTVLLAVGILWCTAVRWSWTRRIVVPRSAPLAAAGAFAVGITLATLTSTSRLQSVVGQYQQYEGLASYLACLVVFGATLRAFRREHLLWLLRADVVAMLGVAAVGLLQMADLGPAKLWTTAPDIVSTLGNQNFVAGWLATAIGPCIVLCARREELLGWRVAAGVGGVGGLIVLVGANSFQGPVAAGVAIVVAVAAVVVVHRPLERWWNRRNVLLAAGGVLALVVVVGVVGGSYIRSSIDEGMYDRRAFWSAAVHVVEDHPLVGTGPDTFHDQFLQRRPAAHSGNNAGAVHNVPLDLLANGGLVTGLPYLAFLGLTLVALVRVWRRARGSDLLLVGGLAAAWAGYVVQSVVSIDRPGLIVTHWVVAGAIAGLAVTREPIVLTLPGAVAGRRQAHRGPGWLVGAAVASIVALGSLVPLTRPIRATVAVAAAQDAVNHGNLDTAISKVEEARRLAPWVASHTYMAARVFAFANRPKDVIAQAEAGARLAPGDATYAIFAAQAALAAGDEAVSIRWWDEAIRRDPQNHSILLQAINAAGERHDHATMTRLLRTVRRQMGLMQFYGAEASARILDGDIPGAIKAYQQALVLVPGDKDVEKRIADLQEQLGR